MQNIDEYQDQAFTYRVTSASPEERVMGLLEESGEVAGIFKRLLRGDYTPDMATTKLHAELGDILWYLSQIAYDNGFRLSDIAKENLAKLESRKLRNTLLGNGDTR